MIIVFGRYFDLLLSEQAIPLTVNNTQLRERSYLARAKKKILQRFRVQCSFAVNFDAWGSGVRALVYVRLA